MMYGIANTFPLSLQCYHANLDHFIATTPSRSSWACRPQEVAKIRRRTSGNRYCVVISSDLPPSCHTGFFLVEILKLYLESCEHSQFLNLVLFLLCISFQLFSGAFDSRLGQPHRSDFFGLCNSFSDICAKMLNCPPCIVHNPTF